MKRATAAALAGIALLLSLACSDGVGLDDANVVITGRVSSDPGGLPIGGATIRLMSAPTFAGQRTFVTAPTDADGRYEVRARLDDRTCDGSSWGVQLEASHVRYGSFSMPVGCSRRTLDIRLLSHVIGVRIEPAGGAVRAGSVTEFTAVVTLADATESAQPDPELWELFWAVANDVVSTGGCGSLENAETNRVLFRAPDSPPAGGCSSQGGPAVSLDATAYGFSGGAADERVQITITNE
ncbi:MAG: carboxypeptidase-like regulatory domain-containing protein [Acidimicrobiia bacterium]